MASRAKAAAPILIAALVAALPVLHGLAAGDDFQFHLLSWLDAQQSWKLGVFYPHWAPSANYGAGEPRFLFYPPLTWMLGAGLGLLLPWKFVPAAMLFLLLAATGFATRALARKLLPEEQSTLAGCIAILSGYALYTAYARAAFAELAGGFWIPLLLLFALSDRRPQAPGWQRALDGSSVPLALAIAGAWLSNIPVGIMASYLLAAIAILIALQTRSWFALVRAGIATVVGLGLTGIYLAPATLEQHSINAAEITDLPIFRMESHFLFPWHADPVLSVHGIGLSFVALLLAIPLLGVAAFWMRRKLPHQEPSRRRWIALGSLPLAVLLLHLPVSEPLWNLLPRLRYLQYPWRWLLVLEAPTGIFLAATLWPGRSVRLWQRVGICLVCAGLLLASVDFATRRFLLSRDQSGLASLLDAYKSGAGFDGIQEYAERGWDNSLVAMGLPDACLVADPNVMLGAGGSLGENPHWSPELGSCIATAAATVRQPEHRRIALTALRSGYLVLRLRSYPAWRITVNGQPTTPISRDGDGLIAIPVPAGFISVAVDWMSMPDAGAGRAISGASLILLAGLYFEERRLRGIG